MLSTASSHNPCTTTFNTFNFCKTNLFMFWKFYLFCLLFLQIRHPSYVRLQSSDTLEIFPLDSCHVFFILYQICQPQLHNVIYCHFFIGHFSFFLASCFIVIVANFSFLPRFELQQSKENSLVVLFGYNWAWTELEDTKMQEKENGVD